MLTPLAVDSSHPFPQVVNKSHNLIIRARKPRSRGEPRLCHRAGAALRGAAAAAAR